MNNIDYKEWEYDYEHPYYGALVKYDIIWVFESFKNNTPLWTPLINPKMYQKALDEFTQYGEFIKFPVKYIYQQMGIIMKNTAILNATTAIAGHSSYSPEDDFLDIFFNNDYDAYNDYCNTHNYDPNDMYQVMSEYLDEVGFFGKYCILPDGTDPWSDYGLYPIEKLISKYSSDMEPEKVIVLINKILDVYHTRGDLASAFIIGGSKTLSKISNGLHILEKYNSKLFNFNKSIKILNEKYFNL